MTMEYGTITGRLVAAVADTTDDPDVNPDIVPISGTVTFTPSVKAILVVSEDITVVPAPIVAALDANGYVSLNGVQGVTVLATNSTYYNPTGWTYRVSFDNLAANGRRVTFDPYNIEVPVGANVDLSFVTPITGSTGTPIVRGPKGDTGDTGPQGPQGIPGNNIPTDTAFAGYAADTTSQTYAALAASSRTNFLPSALSQARIAVATDPQFAGGMSPDKTGAQNKAAFDAACAASSLVYIPAGRKADGSWGAYQITPLTQPARVSVFGHRNRAYTGVPTSGTVLQCLDPSVTGTLYTANVGNLSDLAIVGAGKSGSTQHDGLATDTTSVLRVLVTACRHGLNANYKGGFFLELHTQGNFADGVRNTVDSTFFSCYTNANGGNGVNWQTGANDNQWTGGKVEWNDGHGIGMFQTSHNHVITVIDRNGRNGVSTSNTKNTKVDAMFRRNGRLSQGVAADDAHLSTENDVDPVFDMRTDFGPGDSGEGYNSPAVSVRINGGTRTEIRGHLTGCTTAEPLTIVSAATNPRIFADGIGSRVARIQRLRVNVSETSGSLAASGSLPLTLATASQDGTFTTGSAYVLTLLARNTSTAARRWAEIPFLISRNSGDAGLTVGTVTNVAGTDFALTGGTNINVALAVDATGTVLTATLTNAGTNSYSVTGIVAAR